MLDLLISYINFLILSISYIVKKFAYLPPNPPKYLIINKKVIKDKKENKIEEKEEILFLMKTDRDNLEYKKLKPKYLHIEYSKIITEDYSLPILIISPIFRLPICIIYCQGNSGDLGTSLFECFETSVRCSSVIITFEYPGYGICKNEDITESEFYKRIKIVYNYIINSLKYSPNQIIIYGFSLGTGIAFDFACRKEYPVAGLILQSPFLSIIRTIYNIKKTPYFDIFNNCDKAHKLCTKTLFLHGDCDTIVPYIHGRILAKLIPEKYFYDFLTVHKAGHNNLLKTNKDTVFEYINKFIQDCTENFSYYEENSNLEKYENIDNNKDNSKSISLIKSDNIELKKDEEIQNKSNYEDEEKFKSKIKANSYINCSIINKIKKETKIDSTNNKNVKYITIVNNNNQNPNTNMRYSHQIKKYKINKENQTNVNQKIYNYSNKFYHVNIGTYRKNNKFDLYKKYCHSPQTNRIKLKEKSFENSMASINSSTNNITYSK